MRLTKTEIHTITRLGRKFFGEKTRIFLFGSRTDDIKKGGDIDLFISNSDEGRLTLYAKISFLSELKQRIGDQKIDVILDNANTRQKQNFYHSILNQQIELTD
jgi:predicted nucleotidyltransferase